MANPPQGEGVRDLVARLRNPKRWSELHDDDVDEAARRLEAAVALAKSVEAYELERENPAPDYTMRLVLRRFMFENLAAWRAAGGRTG